MAGLGPTTPCIASSKPSAGFSQNCLNRTASFISAVGQSVTFTATVTSSTSGVPTGAVTFKSGTKTLGAVQLTNGSASLSTTSLASGSNTITATYNGSPNFTGSSNTLTQVVN
jgi:Big-like domain-containing protein